MCCYESTFRAHTRGNIDQFAKNRTWVFSNPEVLEKTDSLYIDLSAKKSSESREVSPGIVLDYDDENLTWRIIYRIYTDAILILEVFEKKTNKTPKSIIDICKQRIRRYEADIKKREK